MEEADPAQGSCLPLSEVGKGEQGRSWWLLFSPSSLFLLLLLGASHPHAYLGGLCPSHMHPTGTSIPLAPPTLASTPGFLKS